MGVAYIVQQGQQTPGCLISFHPPLTQEYHLLTPCQWRLGAYQAEQLEERIRRQGCARTAMVSGSGPMKAMPSSAHRRAKVAFSDKNP